MKSFDELKELNTNSKAIPEELLNSMINDRAVRTAVTKQSHYMFFNFYFAHYVKYLTAQFQRELFYLTEQDDIKNVFVTAFRNSGKSTIITTSYPVWAILGVQQKKFVLLVAQTRHQARQHLQNIKRELEANSLLKNDLGPFREDSDEWGSFSLVFEESGTRIMAVSSEQSIRGLRHNEHRPDLIIGDDVEDMASAKTREGRQKTYNWLTSEVIPAGDRNTRLIIVGNLLHHDSLLMHLKRDIEEGNINGVFKFFPLVDEKGKIYWPGKYANLEQVEAERKKIGNEVAWQREYLLHIISDEDQVIDINSIKYYDELPTTDIRKVIIGVDLAISEKATADCTAIVSGLIVGKKGDYKVYILPNPINKRMGFLDTIKTLETLHGSSEEAYKQCVICIEDVAYQAAAIEILQSKVSNVYGVKVTSDKRSRLVVNSPMIEQGKILFPRQGAEQLIEQIVGFGSERHDDLVDAFNLVATKSLDCAKIIAGFMSYNEWDDEWNECFIYG